MSECAVKDCDRDAFIFVDAGNLGLCYPHYRSVWTKTNFYDKRGWQGVPLELKDGRRLRVLRDREGIPMDRPPYGGLQFEPAERK